MTTKVQGALRQLRRALGGEEADIQGDAELLRRFLGCADEDAFAALVRRYGPMVLGVCRRILGQAQDAEDAFQATFLVLARKARSVIQRERIGPYLYGVACRTARKAKGRFARHRAAESQVAAMNADSQSHDETIPDWQPIFDRELQALPEKYRVPIVLCEIQGLSRRDAARQLRLAEGTLSSRLARGRQLLRERLERQGFRGTSSLTVAVPIALAGSTARAAVLVASGKAAGAVSASVLSLMEGVLQTMVLSKCKLGLALLALVGLMTGLGSRLGAPLEAAPPSKEAAAETPKRSSFTPLPPTINPELQGTWRVVSARENGNAATKEQLQEMTVDFDGDQFTVSRKANDPEQRSKATFTIDGTSSPKQISLTSSINVPGPLGSESRRVRRSGIFELKQDRLRLCFSRETDSAKPPTLFRADQGDNTLLLILERKPPRPLGPTPLALPLGFQKSPASQQPEPNIQSFLDTGTVESERAPQPVARIHGRVPVTRQELGEFLVERYGAEKLEALVNKRIIDLACEAKGIRVAAEEIDRAIAEDLKSIGVSRDDFVQKVLKQHGKSLFEWREDVVKPQLQLAKLGQSKIKVTDEDLRREYDIRHGPKVKCKVLIWPKGTEKDAIREHQQLRANPEAAAAKARETAWGTLKALGNREFAVPRYADDPDGQRIADEVFKLKPGELSPLFPVGEDTYALLCMGRIGREDAIDFEHAKPQLLKDALERKLGREIPKLFESLRKDARPELFLKK